MFVCLCLLFLSRLDCLSSPGINERVHITLRRSHINARRLINPITQPRLPASLTFKITKAAASLAVDWLQLKYCSGNLQAQGRLCSLTFAQHFFFFFPLTVICDQISFAPQQTAAMFKALEISYEDTCILLGLLFLFLYFFFFFYCIILETVA